MQAYWGAVAIAQRMGWSVINPTTPLHSHIRKYAFPAYKRCRRTNHLLTTWYSDEAMIQQWQLSMCRQIREGLLSAWETKRAEKKLRQAKEREKDVRDAELSPV